MYDLFKLVLKSLLLLCLLFMFEWDLPLCLARTTGFNPYYSLFLDFVEVYSAILSNEGELNLEG